MDGNQGVISDVDVNKVKAWIVLNKKVLIKYWNHKYSTNELYELLKEVESEIDTDDDHLQLGISDTGLAMNIWVIVSKTQKKAIIKAQNNYNQNAELKNTFSLTISIKPVHVSGRLREISKDDIHCVKAWIINNKQRLLKHWNGKISKGDLLPLLVKVDPISKVYSGLSCKTTGLPMVIWVMIPFKHPNPIIMVANNYNDNLETDLENVFSMTISDNPIIVDGKQGLISDEDLREVKTWIVLNKKDLLLMWKYKFSGVPLLSYIEKIS